MSAPEHVRLAQMSDMDRVTDLWISITEHHRSLDPVFHMRPDSQSEIRELLDAIARDPDAVIFVYDDDGDLPGMCIVRVDHSPPIMRETERAEITDIGVRPGRRRSGIASQLLAAALGWVRASGIDRVEVQVASANREGQAFWRARGFGDLMDVLHRRI